MKEMVVVIRRTRDEKPLRLLLAEKIGGLGMLFLLAARLLLWPSPELADVRLLASYWFCHVCGWTLLSWGALRYFKPSGKKL